MALHRQLLLSLVILVAGASEAFVPFLDGGKDMPALYQGWFNDQIAKQASTAIGKALAAGKKKLEVQFPPVPNVEEAKFGSALNQKFGTTIVAKELNIKGGYRPGSNLSRNLLAYGNMYWAKKVAPSVGGLSRNVAVLSAEQVAYSEIQSKGAMSFIGPLSQNGMAQVSKTKSALIFVNPGGEETWDRLYSSCGSPAAPVVVLNNAYSTTYDLGNKRGYEEAYYLKRVSKGWVFRAFPGPWQAYLERPDGSVELLESFREKPSLQVIATLVREESFRRYAIMNDRFAKGFGGRL